MESAEISSEGDAEISMGTLNLDGGTVTLHGGRVPLQFKYCLKRHFQRNPGAATYAPTPLTSGRTILDSKRIATVEKRMKHRVKS